MSRKTFVPVVLLGLGSGTLAAVAANRTWARGDGSDGDFSQVPSNLILQIESDRDMPLALSLSLVALAAWGVLLATRGAVRRILAVLALAAALGVVATVIAGHQTMPGEIRADFEGLRRHRCAGPLHGVVLGGRGGRGRLGDAAMLAVREVRDWPEMGSRYDAPGGGPADDPESNLDMWKAIDEGRDPTE